MQGRKCLHNQRRVNTYAIGIARADQEELECIIDDDIDRDEFHLFNFESFDTFEDIIEQIIQLLLQARSDPYNDPFVCIDPRTAVGTEGCVYV